MNQTAKPEVIWVQYKGTEFELQPGYKVYECNTDTGLVKEHKLKKVFRWPWQEKKKMFKPVYKFNIQHLPCATIEKAILEFKIFNADLIRQRKKEGNVLTIHK